MIHRFMMAPKAIVFWDLDSCLSINHSAPDAVAGVRRLVLNAHAGEIRKVNAYYGPSRFLPASLSCDGPTATARNEQSVKDYLDELKCNGVTVIDTSFLGGEECTTKAMIVDILLEMVDATKAPPTVLVISNNPSMKYPTSSLINRHRIVHLVSASDHDTAVQHMQANPGKNGSIAPGAGHNEPTTATISRHNEDQLSPTTQIGGIRTITLSSGANSDGLESSQSESGPTFKEPTPKRIQDCYPSLPEKFFPLVEALDLARERGYPEVQKSLLGNMILEKFPNAYKGAGVKDFKKYIALAEKEGVIEVRGAGTEAVVATKISPETSENPWADITGNNIGGIGVWN